MAGWILKSLLLAYVLTGILLLVLAMLLYKLDMDEKAVSAGIVAIYITATLILITIGVYRTLDGAAASLITTFLLCAGGGTIGGMIS